MTQPEKPDVRELMDKLDLAYKNGSRISRFEPLIWDNWPPLRRHLEQMEAELVELRAVSAQFNGAIEDKNAELTALRADAEQRDATIKGLERSIRHARELCLDVKASRERKRTYELADSILALLDKEQA